MTIHPYLDHGVWVFDDPAVGLVKEALVAGMPEIIRHMIGREEHAFTVVFSDIPFPSHNFVLCHLRGEDFGGDWYALEGTNLEGWLCPALLKYFPEAPENLYLEVRT
jgi:hypothetical protein